MRGTHFSIILRLQALIGWVMVVFSMTFPAFIYWRYGFQAGPIYGGDGSLRGRFVYFYLSVAFSLFFLAVGIFNIFMAKKFLARYASKKKEQKGAWQIK